jgi:hypothetical protein
MIPKWPYQSPYAEAAARLREAIDEAAIRDAVDEFTASMGAVARAHVSNNHATNIRDTLDSLTDESDRP